jgi:hypothetical protein
MTMGTDTSCPEGACRVKEKQDVWVCAEGAQNLLWPISFCVCVKAGSPPMSYVRPYIGEGGCENYGRFPHDINGHY